jgi:hypothetical protein
MFLHFTSSSLRIFVGDEKWFQAILASAFVCYLQELDLLQYSYLQAPWKGVNFPYHYFYLIPVV